MGEKKIFFRKFLTPQKNFFSAKKNLFLVSYFFYGHFRLWKAFESHIYRFFGINMIKKGLNEPIINITIHMSTVLLNRESTIGRFWNTTASPPGLSHRAPAPTLPLYVILRHFQKKISNSAIWRPYATNWPIFKNYGQKQSYGAIVTENRYI